jgi:hypothetical protein
VFQSSGGGLGNRFIQPRRPAFRDHHGAGAGGVGSSNDGAQVVRVFDAVEQDQQESTPSHFIELGVSMGRPQGHYALVHGAPRLAVQGTSRLKSDGYRGGPAKVYKFLNTWPAGTPGDQDPLHRPAGPQRFQDRMKSHQRHAPS